MNIKFLLSVCLVCCSLFCVATALNNGLVRTPPMGWLAWERYRCNIDCLNYPDECINENLFTTVADYLVDLGLRDVGYTLVNIDDCWSEKTRDSRGSLQADAKRFSHGIKWLSNYMHARGLKLGIYEDYGNLTCGGYPGSYGYLQTDANTFAEWGADMLKLDGCNIDVSKMAAGNPEMGHYLKATGRRIIYRCSWPAYMIDSKNIPWNDIALILGKVFTPLFSIQAIHSFIAKLFNITLTSPKYWAKLQDTLAPLAAPGQWNDPDMLIIGDFSLSLEESKSQFAIWAIIAAPLFISNDLSSISSDALDILLNQEIIAVDQDPLGIQGKRVYENYQLEVWARPLKDNAVAVVFFNGRSDGVPYPITIDFKTVGFKATNATIRDLYTHVNLGIFQTRFTAKRVVPHGVVMVKLTPYTPTHQFE